MSTAAFKIRGLAELTEQLTEMRAKFAAKALAAAARRSFKPVLDAAKAMVPRDSGDLADALKIAVEFPKAGDEVVAAGIKVGVGRNSKQAKLAAAAFGEAQSTRLPPARRWHFIELGTSKMAPHPYLRPALAQNARAVLDLIVVELRKSIDAAVKKGRF